MQEARAEKGGRRHAREVELVDLDERETAGLREEEEDVGSEH